MSGAGRLLLISRVLSPFQLELVRALRERGCEARVLFSNADIGTRPKHWRVPTEPWVYTVDVESAPLKLQGVFDDAKPDVVVYGGYRGWPIPVATRLCRARGIGLAFWLEPPFPTSVWRDAARETIIRRVLAPADYVLCIGPRSLLYFRRLMADRGRLHCVPYGQDLTRNFDFVQDYDGRGVPGKPLRFLFSGKYQHRNNIWEMLAAFRTVRRRHGAAVEFVLSGYSGMEAEVRAAVEEDPVLREATTHDVDFGTWDDRLRPFRNSDVLVIPGLHAGWGLIVPEAMSLGMPVIGTEYVESVRYLVKDRVNGLVIQPTAYHLTEAMERFMEDPSLLGQLGPAAREASRQVDARSVASQLIEAIGPHLRMGATSA